MRDDLCIILIVLVIWLILYLLLEFRIINEKRKTVKKLFLELDNNFIKRFNILSKMLDVIKAYDKNQFDEFGSNLYDYINNYGDYDYNKRLKINEELNIEIKKVLLARKVYPELNEFSKYVKLEKQLIRLDKIISKLQVKYNRALSSYKNRRKIFPSEIICVICRFYSYNYFNLNK